MEDWEEREWDRRVKQLPNKILNGIIKYHAVTLVMRLYEHIASLKYDELTLDRLTMDSFSASKRVAQREIDSQVIRQKTYDIGLWSTVIAYLADYTVYQVILAYTYYKYYQRKKARKQSLKVDMEDGNLEGAVALSLLTKSSSLAASRILGWYANAWGGSWGTLMYPGWGTLMAGQFCDGFIASVFDELQPVTVE
mmetsp:Transcript_6332/g.9113  ORF Transcript_6332/g.9113 Transcript_6332/m.9113 type:complete len:195 (-) Transcript_6332:1272-1856(-)